jgi:hypothetical protein
MAMERVTVEQNGERFTLEVPEGTSDEQIQSFLTEQQGGKKQGEDLTPLLAPAAAAAVPAVAKGVAAIPEAYETGKNLVAPAAQATGSLLKTYATRPSTAVVDLAAHSIGLPPPTAATKAYEGISNTYGQVQDYLNKTGKFAPKPPMAVPGAGMVPNEVGQAAELSSAMTPEELVSFANSGQSQTQLAAQQAQKTAQIAATQGPAAAEGSNFIQTITQKFAPIAAKVAPVLNNPVVKAAGTVGNAALPLQALHGASNQAETANMNSPEFNMFGSTARGGKSFADWFNEVSGQNKKYEEMRRKQREGLTGQ